MHKAGLLRAWTLTQREGIIGSYFTHPSWSLWLKKGIQSFHVRGTCRAPSKYIRHIYTRKILHYTMLYSLVMQKKCANNQRNLNTYLVKQRTLYLCNYAVIDFSPRCYFTGKSRLLFRDYATGHINSS